MQDDPLDFEEIDEYDYDEFVWDDEDLPYDETDDDDDFGAGYDDLPPESELPF